MDPEIWRGSLPVTVAYEAASSQNPVSLLIISMSRCSYLPLYTNQIRKFFVESGHELPEGNELNVWYSFKGCPLKWHLPVGLLFDLYADENDTLPWAISVHFDSFPDTALIPMTGFDAVSQLFTHTMKQSDFIWNGVTKVAMTLTKQEQTNLWDGILSDDYEKFLSVSRKIRSEDEMPRHIPLRMYTIDKTSGVITMLQDLVLPLDSNGDMISIGEATVAVTGSTASKLVLHGVEIPHEAPLLYLSFNMHYPDGFLHVCLKR